MSLSRRAALRLLGATVLAGGGVVGAVRTSGYRAPEALRALRPWEYVVVRAAALRIVNPDREDMPSADAVGVAEFVDGFMLALPKRARRDLGQLLGYLEHIAPFRSGYRQRFSSLSSEAQDRVLSAMELGDETLLRGAFAGLKSCVLMGYYRDPRTWKAIGYTGPFVPSARERAP